jgi:serine/threonine-protein kinase RsbW
MKDLLGTVVTVSVPARADMVHVLRSVTAGVAARMDLSYDDIDDLRIAVDEACAQLLLVSAPTGQITLRLSPQQEGLDVTATVRGEGVWPPPSVEDTLAWRVLSGLVDVAEFSHQDGAMQVRMFKRLPEENDGPR